MTSEEQKAYKRGQAKLRARNRKIAAKKRAPKMGKDRVASLAQQIRK